MVKGPGILLAGGGTAGHINPLLALADELGRRLPQVEISVLGTKEGLEARLVPEHGLPLVVIPKLPLPRRPTLDVLRLPKRLAETVRQIGDLLDERQIKVVVGFGGYVSTPAYLAAHNRGIPIVIHEQNARPGLANRLGARWAADVAVTFAGTPLPRAQVTGLPLRSAIAELVSARMRDPEASRREAAAKLGLDPERVTLVVSGGSLGAASVNRSVAAVAAALVEKGAQVLHLTGVGKAGPVQTALDQVPGTEHYHVREYLNEMELALAVADLFVARAGAGTVAELTALGIPAIYVPLAIGNGEQRLNAAPVVAAGGGLLVEDAQFDPQWVSAHLPVLLGADGAKAREKMSAAAAKVGVSDGAVRLADLVTPHVTGR